MCPTLSSTADPRRRIRDDEALAAALRAVQLALDGDETDAAQHRPGQTSMPSAASSRQRGGGRAPPGRARPPARGRLPPPLRVAAPPGRGALATLEVYDFRTPPLVGAARTLPHRARAPRRGGSRGGPRVYALAGARRRGQGNFAGASTATTRRAGRWTRRCATCAKPRARGIARPPTVGGRDRGRSAAEEGAAARSAAVELYDPARDRWRAVASRDAHPAPRARRRLAAAAASTRSRAATSPGSTSPARSSTSTYRYRVGGPARGTPSGPGPAGRRRGTGCCA